MKSVKRVDYIDGYRFFGILLMVMGHVGFGTEFNHWIHAFHMPMFFFISGYFYKKQEIGVLFRKRFFALWTPFIVFEIFHIALYGILNGSFSIISILQYFTYPTYEIPIAGALWFLPALFFAELFYHVTMRINIEWVKSLVIVLISSFGIFISKYIGIQLPLAVDVACVGVGLYHLGRLLKEKYYVLINLNVLITVIIFVFFSYSSLFSGYINMRTGTYSQMPMFWINSIGMSIAILNTMKYVYSVLERYSIGRIILGYMNSVGKNSIVYVCLNQLVLLIIILVLNKLHIGIELIQGRLLVLLLVLCCLKIVEYIVLKTPLRRIIGR